MGVEVLGVPVDLGADRRGVDMGPSAIRYAGLLPRIAACGVEVSDLGNLPLMLPETEDAGSSSAKYLGQIVTMSKSLCASVTAIVKRGSFPMVLGGDHSVSLGTVAGVTSRRPCGLIWFDAHGDFNTPETTPSGNVHGMILAALAGLGDRAMVEIGGRVPIISPSSIALVGVRELDPGERDLLTASGVHVSTMTDIDRRGMPAVMEEAIAVATEGKIGGPEPLQGLHLSLDLDVVDPLRAPGVGTPVPGGIGYREAQLAMEMVASSGTLRSMDVVEVNPILDDHNQTGRLAADFILSALGKRIL